LRLALPVAVLLAGCSASAPAKAKPECAGLPAPAGRVVDRADMLSDGTEAGLMAELAALEGKTRDQLVVVTLPSLGGRPIEEVGLKLGRCWGIGQKQLDNGVLLVVAKADRKLRIEVGYGLEGLLKDEVAGQILRDAVEPQFRQGRFDAGVEAGVARIEQVLLSNKARPQRRPPPGRI
jgi:uncharacterized protein